MEREENPRDCLVKKTKHNTLNGAREESTGLSGEEDLSTLPWMEREENPQDCLVKKTKHITLTGAREESTGLCGKEQ